MLDENLPTFTYRPSSDNPSHTSILYYTAHGSEPSPSYVFRRADPSTNPASRGKYAAALTDPYSTDVVYAEAVITPQWQQPTLSAAEARATSSSDPAAAPVPIVPDSFTIQLYDPDTRVEVRMVSGTWGRSETWEFEMPTQTFHSPSASQLDRQQQARERQGSGCRPADDVVRDIAPKIMFKWKRDGRLSKDMTAYMVGRSLGRHKSKKEPDITVALFEAGKESAVAIYEPNMQRVEVEDRKGLDIVLLLGAEVIRDLYLTPRQDLFNIAGAASAAVNGRPVPVSAPSRTGPPAMSGAIRTNDQPVTTIHNAAPGKPKADAALDAETARLKKMVEAEEREAKAKQERERAAREREAQRATEALLAREKAEEKERARRAKEVDKETERLRKLYGTEGQSLPSQAPALPPRHGQQPAPVPYAIPPGHVHLAPAPWQGGAVPPRPVSAGPSHGPQYAPPPQQQENGGSSSWWKKGRRNSDEERKKMNKKRSVHF